MTLARFNLFANQLVAARMFRTRWTGKKREPSDRPPPQGEEVRVFFALAVYDGGNKSTPPARARLHLPPVDRTARFRGVRPEDNARLYAIEPRDASPAECQASW
jgi:hypothetical protein